MGFESVDAGADQCDSHYLFCEEARRALTHRTERTMHTITLTVEEASNITIELTEVGFCYTMKGMHAHARRAFQMRDDLRAKMYPLGAARMTGQTDWVAANDPVAV